MMMTTTTTTTNTNTNTTTNTHTHTHTTTTDTNDAQLIPAIMAVLGVRERFTAPMANALGRAHVALLRLANYRDVTADEICARAAHLSLSPTVAIALVKKEAAKMEASAAATHLREAARL